MRTLPPFDGLVAFDAAARHRSMTLAANELRLTQSAISHRLGKLEAFMGAELLIRSPTGLTPTPAGASLLGDLERLLEELAGLRARSRAAASPTTLKIGVGAALAHYWLVRRLPRFAEAQPDLSVELVVAENETQARAADVDLQIAWQPKATARASSTQKLLFSEHVFPVAAPRLLPRRRALRALQALADLPILHKGPQGRNDGAEWSWPVWFERLGIDKPVPPGLRFDAIGTTLTAAIEGAGVALARRLLAHDALADRRLCRVLPQSWDMPSSKAHLIRWPAALSGDRRVRSFTRWIVGEAVTSVGP